MARTQINATSISRTGVAPVAGTAADPVNKNQVTNDGKTWIEVKNTDAAARTVSIPLSLTVDGQAVTARSYTIAAGATLLIGPFTPNEYGAQLQIDADSALVTISPYRI